MYQNELVAKTIPTTELWVRSRDPTSLNKVEQLRMIFDINLRLSHVHMHVQPHIHVHIYMQRSISYTQGLRLS